MKLNQIWLKSKVNCVEIIKPKKYGWYQESSVQNKIIKEQCLKIGVLLDWMDEHHGKVWMKCRN